jgi:hypothetical protein
VKGVDRRVEVTTTDEAIAASAKTRAKTIPVRLSI